MLESPRCPLDSWRLVEDEQTHVQVLHKGPAVVNEPPMPGPSGWGLSRRVSTSTNANPASELKSNVRLLRIIHSCSGHRQATKRGRESERETHSLPCSLRHDSIAKICYFSSFHFLSHSLRFPVDAPVLFSPMNRAGRG